MKSLILHASVASIACLCALVGYNVWYGMIQEKSTEVATLQSQIDAEAQSKTRIESARASLAELAQYESGIQNYFVPETSVVSFIDILQSTGTSQGASVNVSSVAKQGSPTTPVLAFTLTIMGSFDAVMRTVGAVEYAPYALTITSFAITQSDKKSWSATMSLEVGSQPTASSTTSQP